MPVELAEVEERFTAIREAADTIVVRESAARGPTGAQGPQGDVGPQGETGPQGEPGADSTVPGPQGEQGPTGPTGPQGDPGADSTVPGPEGPAGPAGATGATGATGEASTVPGPAGPTGATGPPGVVAATPPATYNAGTQTVGVDVGTGAAQAAAGNHAHPGTYVALSVIDASGKGFVNHGATASTTRPSGYASVEWYGSVEPTNAVTGDTWVDIT